ncbi:MAG: hypothetical protein K8W52_21705 [Deltaproteobacteria bacterium]|nr:hypothetical protein [Deltaproteobacteria bacterium]
MDWKARLDRISRLSAFANVPPSELGREAVGFATADWVSALKATRVHGIAFWDTRRKQVGVRPGSDLTAFSIPAAFSEVAEAIEILTAVDFGVAGLGSVFFNEWIEADYKRWSFSRSHIDHGWGCAFRGAGHDHLVSRRWLDFGPWRVIRRPNDTTFVQFHDLAITDPAEAYEVAKVGHERMGVSYTGGFIQQIAQWMLDDVPGAYTAADKKLTRVIPADTEVSQLNMLNAATMRRHYRLNPGLSQPVDRIAYVFVVEEQARAYLHELWLRELECWVHDGRGLRRLDADYHPTPTPPDWVRRLDAQ